MVRGGDGGEPLFSLEEIRKVFGKGKMRLAPDSAKYLMILANLPESGSIGLCANLVRMATLLYERKSDVLIADMLRDAHKLLLCRRVYNGVKTQMEAPIRMSKTG